MNLLPTEPVFTLAATIFVEVHVILSHLGYAGVFLALFLEAIGVPFPAETILVTSGIEMTRGVFLFLPLWLFGACGNIVGSNIAYVIGRYFGRPIILKYGKYVRISEMRLQSVEARFQRYQIPFLTIAKFIAFVRIVVPYLAGINKISYAKFTLYNTVSAFAWSALFIVLGNSIEAIWRRYGGFLMTHLYVSIPVVLLILAALAWHHKSSKRHIQSGHEATRSNYLAD